MMLLVRGPEQGLIAARVAARLAAHEGAWAVAWDDAMTSAASLSVHSMLAEVDDVRVGVWCATAGRLASVVGEARAVRALYPDRTIVLTDGPADATSMAEALDDPGGVGWLATEEGDPVFRAADGTCRRAVAVPADQMLEPGFHVDARPVRANRDATRRDQMQPDATRSVST